MSRAYYYSRTRSYPKHTSRKKLGWFWIISLSLIVIIYLSTSTNILDFVYSNQYPFTIEIDVTDRINGQ